MLAPAQVWMLANFVVTTRGAKRVFGLIGSGAIAGWIGGGLVTQTIVPRVGADNMLLGVAAALAVCAVLVLMIWRERPPAIAGHSSHVVGGRGLRDGLTLVWHSPHLRAIATLILISSFVTTIAGWQFKAIAKAEIPQTDALAAFFGAFNLYAGLASLFVQLLLTAPLLRTFGIGFGLLLVPVLMAMGTAGVLVTGSLAAAVFLKGSDQVLRYSIDKATTELLYLPVPRADTFQAKSVIDTVVWRCGDGLAGLLVLVLAGWLGLSAPQLGWVNLALVGLWMAAALVAGKRYVSALTESIHQHRLDIERASTGVLDRTGAGIMAEGLASRKTADILYALDLFRSERRRRSHPAVVGLLSHADPDVRRQALRVLIEAGDASAAPAVEPLLKDERIDVRTEALLYLAQYTGHRSTRSHRGAGCLRRLLHSGGDGRLSGAPRGRAESGCRRPDARCHGALRRRGRPPDAARSGPAPALAAARLRRRLRRLLGDMDPDVAREAVIAAGALGARPFLRDIIDRLADPLIVPDAVDALALCGDSGVGALTECLADRSMSRAIRREIPSALLGIATPAAHSALVEHLERAGRAHPLPHHHGHQQAVADAS